MTDEEWEAKRLQEGGFAGVGFARVGQARVGTTRIGALRRAEGETAIRETGWAKVLREVGAISLSHNPNRPYIWLWELQDLAGLHPYTPFSWSEWAAFFYWKGKPVQPTIRNNKLTSWGNTKALPARDDTEAQILDLPAILNRLRPHFSVDLQ